MALPTKKPPKSGSKRKYLVKVDIRSSSEQIMDTIVQDLDGVIADLSNGQFLIN